MAKILFGAGVGDARGSIGAHTFTKTRNGAMLRMHVSPVQPRTDRQLAVRALFVALSKRWADVLADSDRASWLALAAVTNFSNAFGNSYHPTGLQLYQMCNRNLQLIGQPIIDVAPADLQTDQLLTLAGAASAGGATFTLAFTATPTAASQYLCVDGTAQVNAGRAFVQSLYRYLDFYPPAKNSPADIFAAYVAKYGALRLGQKIGVRAWLINGTNGAAGQELTDLVTVAP